jgi:hypothetical protein
LRERERERERVGARGYIDVGPQGVFKVLRVLNVATKECRRKEESESECMCVLEKERERERERERESE